MQQDAESTVQKEKVMRISVKSAVNQIVDSFTLLGYLLSGASLLSLIGAIFAGLRKKKPADSGEMQPSVSVSREPVQSRPAAPAPLPENDQERWNMPGFASLKSHPYKGTFNFRNYRLREHIQEQSVRYDLESFTKHFLNYFNTFTDAQRVTLLLITADDSLEPVMERRGNIFLSGSASGLAYPGTEMLRGISDGKFILDTDGLKGCFPLKTDEGTLGAVLIQSARPMFNPETIRKINSEISRYADFLYQFRIYEQANRDPATGLLNGMRFHEDLIRLFHSRRNLKNHIWLVLIQFPSTASDPFQESDALSAAGILTDIFPPDSGNTLYRISSDAFAVTGPAIRKDDINDLYNFLKQSFRTAQKGRLSRYAAAAVVAAHDFSDAQEWFSRAGLCLEESALSGNAVYLEKNSSRLIKY